MPLTRLVWPFAGQSEWRGRWICSSTSKNEDLCFGCCCNPCRPKRCAAFPLDNVSIPRKRVRFVALRKQSLSISWMFCKHLPLGAIQTNFNKKTKRALPPTRSVRPITGQVNGGGGCAQAHPKMKTCALDAAAIPVVHWAVLLSLWTMLSYDGKTALSWRKPHNLRPGHGYFMNVETFSFKKIGARLAADAPRFFAGNPAKVNGGVGGLCFRTSEK